MPSDRQRYAAKLNEIALRYGRREASTLRDVWRLLRTVRDEIAGALAGAEGFRAYQLKELQASVDRYLAQFDAAASAVLRDGLRDAYLLGGASVVDPLAVIDVGVAFFQPHPATLNAVLDMSADLIKGITEEARAFVNLQIRQAALGQITNVQAMQSIGQRFGLLNLRPGRETVKGIAYNAERIVRTEMGRTYNLSIHSAQLDTAQRVPELLKTWVASGDRRTRESHLVAHMRYHDNPIPVSEPFRVGGSLLMYPGDPAGEAKEVINCRCRTLTVHPRVGVIGTSLDTGIAAELQRRKDEERKKNEVGAGVVDIDMEKRFKLVTPQQETRR